MSYHRAVIQAVTDIFVHDGSIVGTLKFPRKLQWNGYSCGARCVRMLTNYFDVSVSYADIVEGIGMTEDGSAATPIMKYLRSCGLRAGYHRVMSWKQLRRALERDAIVLVDLNNTHWSIVHAMNDSYVWMANPSMKQWGRRMTHARFKDQWSRLGVTVSHRH